MRDLDALLSSLVNIDRASLIAVLSAEAKAAEPLVISARQRTTSQRAKWQAAQQHAARVERILAFFHEAPVDLGKDRDPSADISRKLDSNTQLKAK
jgi:hypothetical protein